MKAVFSVASPLVLLGAALVVGCSQMPVYERPVAPVAAQWPAYAGQPVAGATSLDTDWRSFFADTVLRDLISLAIDNNRDMRVAVLNIEQARAQFQVRRADALPTVNAAASGNRQPGANGSISSSYSAGLAVSAWEIDFFGRIASLKEAALAQYLATEEGRKATQISLVASVANAWLVLAADEELLRLTRETLVTRESSLKLARLRFEGGVTNALDLRQAESLAEAARVSLAQQVRQRAQDENALTLLLGVPVPPTARAALLASGLADLRALAAEPAGLPSDLLVRRPDIRQAEQSLLAANANIGAARAAFFPRITLSTSFGVASSQLSNLLGSGSWAWTLSPQAALPLFDAGRNQANLGAATAARDIAVAQYEKAIQLAFREVADALAGRATLGEQLQAQQAQTDAEAARYRLADLRYRNGVASSLDALDAQRALFAAQQALVQTRLLQMQNQVTLYKVMGGGWKDS